METLLTCACYLFVFLSLSSLEICGLFCSYLDFSGPCVDQVFVNTWPMDCSVPFVDWFFE